jgi:DNA-binding transcriptional MerR regulator
MTNTLTASEIIATLDISLITFNRWQASGLLPKPEVRQIVEGRGKRGYWPDWTVSRGQRIKRLREQGHGLTAIKKMIDSGCDVPGYNRMACGGCGERKHEVFYTRPDNGLDVFSGILLKCVGCGSETIVTMTAYLKTEWANDDQTGSLATYNGTNEERE